MIKSIQEYFIPTRYYREVTKEDETNFKERAPQSNSDEPGTQNDTFFYNEKTGEVTYKDPKKVIYHNCGRFTFEKLCKTVFKGAVIGLVVSGAPTLAGYCIIQVKYGALIGSALGAIKVYVDSTKGETREMYCIKDANFRRGLGIKPKE